MNIVFIVYGHKRDNAPDRLCRALISKGQNVNILCAFSNCKERYVHIVNLDVFPWSGIKMVRIFQSLLSYMELWPFYRKNKYSRFVIALKHLFIKKVPNIFTTPLTDYSSLASHPLIKAADIVHLHVISNFVDYPSFFEELRNKNFVWTLHDKNPGMGGFHLDLHKIKYPQLATIENEYFKIKENSLKRVANMRLIAISDYMNGFIQENSLLKNYKCSKILNGINSDDFHLGNKKQERIKLGICEDYIVFCFAAQDILSPNKGLVDVIEALNVLYEQNHNICLVCAGKYENIPETKFPIKCYGLIPFDDLCNLYIASDFFLLASREESFAQTPVEAMMCGIPVIGYSVGCIKDVITSQNGIICDSKSACSLLKGIKTALSNIYNSTEIRRIAMEKCSMDLIATQYIELYKNVL